MLKSNFQNSCFSILYGMMIMVYTKFNATPPVIFYKMAKTFVSLFWHDNFLENTKTTEELLQKNKSLILCHKNHERY